MAETPDRRIADAARRRRALIPTSLLPELGLTPHDVRRRIETGALERPHQKVLRVSGAPVTWEQRAEAALLAMPDAALSHLSGCRIHRVSGAPRSDAVVITSDLGANHQLTGVRVRRTGRLHPGDVVVIDGLRVTSLARTLIDVAADVTDTRLRHMIEHELAARRVTWEELIETFRRLAGRGRPGIARARRVLGRIEGSPPTESVLERGYVDLLTAAGIELPEMQVTAPWADHEPGRVDAMYRRSNAIIELDGRRWHIREASFESDRRREQLATIRGWTTTRFTHRQLREDPSHVVRVTRFLANRHLQD